ncbi:putative formin-like protein 7 [Iris pallida]|uniref:Formin-like protein 7 n=1 Tax=Iris pallida TaxID=29817 RepID=A0AAX6DSZ8_IRIPA|nr:putative formin-like protein 7 [Iris pallida]
MVGVAEATSKGRGMKRSPSSGRTRPSKRSAVTTGHATAEIIGESAARAVDAAACSARQRLTAPGTHWARSLSLYLSLDLVGVMTEVVRTERQGDSSSDGGDEVVQRVANGKVGLDLDKMEEARKVA